MVGGGGADLQIHRVERARLPVAIPTLTAAVVAYVVTVGDEPLRLVYGGWEYQKCIRVRTMLQTDREQCPSDSHC